MIHSNLPYPVTHFSVYLHNQLNKNRKDFYKDFFFLSEKRSYREGKKDNERGLLSVGLLPKWTNSKSCRGVATGTHTGAHMAA